MLSLVPGENHVDWMLALPYLEQAMERGGGSSDWTLGDLLERVRDNRMVLWMMTDDHGVIGAGVTTIVRYPSRSVVEVLLFGCRPHSDFETVLPSLKRYAAHVGASIVQGTGRPGWARKLKAQQRIIWEVEV